MCNPAGAVAIRVTKEAISKIIFIPFMNNIIASS
jgi:hypothetical protein